MIEKKTYLRNPVNDLISRDLFLGEEVEEHLERPMNRLKSEEKWAYFRGEDRLHGIIIHHLQLLETSYFGFLERKQKKKKIIDRWSNLLKDNFRHQTYFIEIM